MQKKSKLNVKKDCLYLYFIFISFLFLFYLYLFLFFFCYFFFPSFHFITFILCYSHFPISLRFISLFQSNPPSLLFLFFFPSPFYFSSLPSSLLLLTFPSALCIIFKSTFVSLVWPSVWPISALNQHHTPQHSHILI